MSSDRKNSPFYTLSLNVSKVTGSLWAFIIALVLIIIWVTCGPIFKFSDNGQLVVKTGTSIITFLIVFLIQQCQNKATIAFLLRLNELIAANKRGSNRLIDIEDLDAKELQQLKKFYTELRDLAEKEKDLSESHSLREALEIQKEKKSIQQASVQLKIK